MILVVGLGNPGKEYKGTRHNIGREIAAAFRDKGGLPDFRFEKKWNAEVGEGKIGKERVAVLLPDTMMNKSGNAVSPAVRFYKVKPKSVFLIHDDADIELGRAKLSFGKHSAGHKGVESVRRALGTWDFWRLRVGIQKKKRVDAMKLVLQKFTPVEETVLKKVKKKLLEGLLLILDAGPEKAINLINKN